jgi:hypothetical protein
MFPLCRDARNRKPMQRRRKFSANNPPSSPAPQGSIWLRMQRPKITGPGFIEVNSMLGSLILLLKAVRVL